MTRPSSTKRPLGRTRAQRTRPEALTAAENSPACLVFLAGGEIGRKVELRGDLRVGRDPGCELPLDSDLVSRHHATFRCVGDETELQDHGSTNGTFVNDKSITASTLSDGARIGVGEFVLKYLAPGNAEARYHDEMFRLMSHDGLTDVFNKRYWEEQIGGLVKRANETFCLIILDADHFKRVNDSYGHAAGDAVLRQIAKCARSAISGSERALLARLGGEEFGVILPGMALQAAADQAERIRKVVDDHAFSFGARPIDVTVSLGVAVWEAESGGSAQDVYKRADAQLYRAKQQGRNRVCR